MALEFRSRRRGDRPDVSQLASRLANAPPLSAAVSPDWLVRAHVVAGQDRVGNLALAPAQPRPDAPKRHDARLSPDTIALDEARRCGTSLVDPVKYPPDPRLVARLGHSVCLKHRVLPWRASCGRVTVLVTRQKDYVRIRDALIALFGPVHMALVTPQKMDQALSNVCHKTLMSAAETRTRVDESCRDWDRGVAARWGLAFLMCLAAFLILWPTLTVGVLCGWAVLTLVLNTGLKVAALALHLRQRPEQPVAANPEPARLPIVSLLVPLFKERDVAGALVQRLSRINYPPDRLDVCLVLEADDGTTQKALAEADLPFWMRAIKVPLGTLQTKPRALNYALNFAKGTVIGVYDAEDAPDPDQLNVAVKRFAQRGRKVACLQGKLDFYNTRSNWLARCFSVEYATWFRIILPGLERMGLVIPLGGTTLFFRRDVLEELGGWDAHNVTEDADLGIRLARHGYRTEIIDSTTQEEANARAWPWVKQRSRWLKGYAITYGVHMRNPRKLLRDLGLKRFLGVQLLFAGTISQFLLAPLLWSFWLMVFNVSHPLDGVLSQGMAITLAATFLLCELIGVTVSGFAVVAAGKPSLIKWTPTLHFYFPLAALAAYKGVIELATRPFYWDKTAHGVFAPTRPVDHPVSDCAIQPPRPPRRPIAAE